MRPIRLDARTADRLLSGDLSPDDMPPGYHPVAQLLDAAGAGQTSGALAGEKATVAAMRAATLGSLASVPAHPKKTMVSRVLAVKAAAAAAVLLSAGSAAAATGSLPFGMQNVASHVLAKLGISVPGTSTTGHGDSHGASAGHQGHSTGPNAHAAFGLCTAEAAHSASGHEPNAHATVFPSTTTCTSVPHSGNGTENTSKNQSTTTTEDASTSTTERPGPEHSRP